MRMKIHCHGFLWLDRIIRRDWLLELLRYWELIKRIVRIVRLVRVIYFQKQERLGVSMVRGCIDA